MAKNKQGSFFGKNDKFFVEDPNFAQDNPDSQDLIDNDLDYKDFLSDLNNEDYLENQDYNNYQDYNYNDNYIDDNFQDDYINDFQDQQTSQDQDFAGDYNYDDNQQFEDYQEQTPMDMDNISENEAEEISELLKNISEKLERLESKKKKEISANAPFYAPNAMPYVFIPSQSAGNEVILNELAKLREENYRMQHSQEIQRQLNALKEELNAKLAALTKNDKDVSKQDKNGQGNQASNGQAALLEELQKLNKKIEQLESKSKSEDINQVLELINRLEAKLSSKTLDASRAADEDSLLDIVNQIRSVSLKSDDVLAYIKSIRHALGLSAISHVNEDGEIDYSDLKEEYSEFKKIIATGSLYAKISAICKFNELIAELPVGVHEEIAADFYRIRNKVFGTVLTPEIAAELIYNSASADKERDIYYYFELKSQLDRADAYELPQIAEKFLKLRNRLQNNQYVTYNQNLFNELIEANNEYQYDQSALAKERLEKAKEIFSTLRIGDIVPLNDYSKIRPGYNYKSIIEKLNELQKLIKEKDSVKPQDLQAKLDAVINEIRSVYGEKADAQSAQINNILQEITELKESIAALGEQRHSEIIQELNDLKQGLDQSYISSGLEYLKTQILNLQEELKAKNINYELILNAVNEIKEQFSLLSEYSEYSDYSDQGTENSDAVLEEIRALKEQLYFQKGELDPEILKEVRNLKELLSKTKKEESYQEVLEKLDKLQSAVEQSALAESQDYQTVLTSALEVLSSQVEQLAQKTDDLASFDHEKLLKEIEGLKADIQAVNIPAVIGDGGQAKLAEFQDKLDGLIESVNSLVDLVKDNDTREFAVNVFRDSMIEVLNEITNLKDEYIYQSEKNEYLSNEIFAIKEQLAQYFEDAAQRNEITLINEINQLKELITNNAASGDNQVYKDILNELNAIKEQLALNAQAQETLLNASASQDAQKFNEQLLKNINELKESFLIGKADTDNTFIVETASIREQLNALKQALDFEKISQDIADLKTQIQNALTGIDIDTIRQIIREETNASRTVELAVSVAAIEKQLSELKKDFAKRQESDAAILDYMTRIAELLEKQQTKDFSLAGDIQNLKEEINALKAQKEASASEESQRLTKEINALKEDLSKIAKIAEFDEESFDVLQEAVAAQDTEYTEEPRFFDEASGAVEDEYLDEDEQIQETSFEAPQQEEPADDYSLQEDYAQESIEPKFADQGSQDKKTQKEMLRKHLLESGLSEEYVNEIINSIYPEDVGD